MRLDRNYAANFSAECLSTSADPTHLSLVLLSRSSFVVDSRASILARARVHPIVPGGQLPRSRKRWCRDFAQSSYSRTETIESSFRLARMIVANQQTPSRT